MLFRSTYATELALIYNDIDYYRKNLSSLCKPKSVKTNLVNQPGKSKIYLDPLGNTLIIGAWNYPYHLSLLPTVAAIAAGNTCLIKPSELPANTMQVMAKLINNAFPSNYLYVVEGAVPETTELLKLRFDKIFFTGSPKVGQIVYEAAARQLTPVTLELGGKSPAIVTRHADLKIAARRIVWGKFLNAGQTCVAPDYLLAEESIRLPLQEALKAELKNKDYQFGSSHYVQLINERNFDRVFALIDPQKVIVGGQSDRANRFIAPTLMQEVGWDDPIMQEEIFGPVLPILSFTDYNKALSEIAKRPKPLAAYLFTSDAEEKRKFTTRISFGGGCINETIMHLSNDQLPFGGIGHSGIGHYHGLYGLLAFSHQKPILEKALWGETNLRYPPYTSQKLSWLKRLFK